MQPCECGCGETANKRFVRGHAARNQRRVAGRVAPKRVNSAAVAPGASVPSAAVRPDPVQPFYEVETGAGAAGGGGFGSVSTPDPDPAHLSGGGPGAAPAQPVPGHSAGGGSSSRKLTSLDGGRQVPDRKVVAEVEAHLGLYFMIPAELAILADPYCGPVLLESTPRMVKALAPILAQSERVVRFVTGTSGLMLWAEFFLASKPVIVAAIAHHVTHRVTTEQDPETGDVRVYSADFSQYVA